MSRSSEPWASWEAGRRLTTHCHRDDSELPVLAPEATAGKAGSWRADA